jgi:hypothetical protein
MWHFYQAQPLKPHYAALKEILNAHADNLAAQIDRPWQQQRAGTRFERGVLVKRASDRSLTRAETGMRSVRRGTTTW